jgi:DNA polymerase-3 subunit delta'
MRQALAHLGLKVKLDGQGVDELIARADGSVRVAATLFDNGGLEIIKTAETILDQAEFNGTLALKLGEAVSSREAEPIFVLLCDYLINRVARDANLATQNGNRRGNALAKFHLELTDSIAQSTLYNLDKRQIVLSILRKCHSAQIGL